MFLNVSPEYFSSHFIASHLQWQKSLRKILRPKTDLAPSPSRVAIEKSTKAPENNNLLPTVVS